MYLLMGIFCYCLGFLGDPKCEQLHSGFLEQETRNNKKTRDQDFESINTYKCNSRISCFIPAKVKFFNVIFWPYNKAFVNQACLVKMAGYWPRFFFFHFYGP